MPFNHTIPPALTLENYRRPSCASYPTVLAIYMCKQCEQQKQCKKCKQCKQWKQNCTNRYNALQCEQSMDKIFLETTHVATNVSQETLYVIWAGFSLVLELIRIIWQQQKGFKDQAFNGSVASWSIMATRESIRATNLIFLLVSIFQILNSILFRPRTWFFFWHHFFTF